MTTEQTFSTFHHGHQDLVLAADYNFYGNRLATASSDHKLKVWDKKGDEWVLIDEWRGHDAEITDVSLLIANSNTNENGLFWSSLGLVEVPFNSICSTTVWCLRFEEHFNPFLQRTKLISYGNSGILITAQVKWNGPLSGQILGSIGEDAVCKLWEEDLSQAPNSGRRFKPIMTPLQPKNKLPYVSLDFKNFNTETYLALITRDGILSIMEPKDHEYLAGDWTEWMQDFQVCATPSRSAETSFRVCFHKEKMPCWSAIAAGLDRKALSLVVATLDTAKVYRSDGRRLYIAAELTGARNLIRDVAWANGSTRGYDVIATASKDGVIRIYELRCPAPASVNGSSSNLAALNRSAIEPGKQMSVRPKNAPSGIGAGLAGAARPREVIRDDGMGAGRVQHRVDLVAELHEHRGAVWRAGFSSSGRFSYLST